jgi:5-methylcytosine-specific restriction endonuclease McrA
MTTAKASRRFRAKRKHLSRGSRRHFAKRRLELAQDQGGLCFWCGEPMRDEAPSNGRPHPPLMPTIDHIIPRARGGTNERVNLVAACSDCNNRRGDMPAGTYAMLTRGLRFVGAGFYPEPLLCR